MDKKNVKRKGRTGRQRNNRNNVTNFRCLSHYHDFIILLKWMKKNNFDANCLKPAEFEETSRGILSTKLIPAGEVVISVPEHLMITTKNVLTSYLEPWITQCSPSLSPLQVLCVYLLCERILGEKSFWFPYINILPSSFSIPLYLSDSELEEFPENIQNLAKKQQNDVKSEYSQLKSHLNVLYDLLPWTRDAATYQNFCWAWAVINTRSVYFTKTRSILLSSNVDNYALVPFLDLLNHCPHVKVSASFNLQRRAYEIITNSPVDPYHQVFICYGPHDNTTLFIEYGFTVAVNQYNIVEFKLDDIISLIHDQPRDILEQKFQLLQENNFNFDLFCSNDEISWKLLTVVKALSLKNKDRNLIWKILHGQSDERESSLHSAVLQKLLQTKLDSFYAIKLKNDSHHKNHSAQQLWHDAISILIKALQSLT